MNQVIFQGEHLIWGNLGHSAIVLSFISSILATLSFFFSRKKSFGQKLGYYSKIYLPSPQFGSNFYYQHFILHHPSTPF
jgi:hypothetical protein